MMLELYRDDAKRFQHRLTPFGHEAPSRSSRNFDPASVKLCYQLCGSGHLLLRYRQDYLGREIPVQPAHGAVSVAAIGQTAAGKSYLMLRALSQQLLYEDSEGHEHFVSVNATDANLEAAAFDRLKMGYHEMRVKGLPLAVTGRDHMMPVEFLGYEVSDELIEDAQALCKDLMSTETLPADWWRLIRQPVARRFLFDRRQVLAVVADLPGELFKRDRPEDEDRRDVLRRYDTLVWLVDPAVSKRVADFLPDEVRAGLLGSMRPDEVINPKEQETRDDRDTVQQELATVLTHEGTFADRPDQVQQLLICVSKVDLLYQALASGRGLDRLGSPNEVLKGMRRYLKTTVKRALENPAVSEDARNYIVARLGDSWGNGPVREALIDQLAGSLLTHYSDPAAFWNLVHGGEHDTVKITPGRPEATFTYRVPVPSIDEYMTASLTPGNAGLLQIRDLVMSALGAGVVSGMGLGDQIGALLANPRRDIRFLLCSPLGNTPLLEAGTDRRIITRDHRGFADVTERSAALTQLLLNMLRGERA
ncbi:hypothetical protein ACWED2_42510 [Amycolatopsis sp. NPDC005003]